MHIQADRALIPAHTGAVRYLTIQVTAPDKHTSANQRPPVSVALVLDRSGSMDGNKIEMAREAVAHAIKLLHVQDRLAVIVYDDRVETLLGATPASAEAKKTALARLGRVEARGSTNLSGGWFTGVDEISGASSGSSAGVTRALLLTDGLANQGVVDFDELVAAARAFREKGISTSTFGVGADFDEVLLSTIATAGGGNFYFIEKATQIPDFLASELGETLDIVARDVLLDLTCSAGVDAMVLNGFATDASSGRVRVRIGDLVAGQEILLAVAISCAPHLPGSTASVDCRVTDRDAVLYGEPMRIEWRATDAAANERQSMNPAVMVAVAEVLAERARATALAANRRGEYDEARRVIRDMIEHLLSLAPGDRQVLAIVDRLRRDERELGGAMDAMLMKSRHFTSHRVAFSRDPEGKARRRPTPKRVP